MSDTYDAVIIGAGIGGLVCGCYLTRAGMKVLICEQHHKPGGYCTSFRRGTFLFDAAADCFGAYREDGITRKVFEDLGIDKRLNIIRFNPSSIVMTPDYKVSFWNDLDMTIEEFQKAFPDESENIKNFFYFLSKSDSVSFSRIKNMTFQNLLDEYFTNYKLKAVLSFPLLAIGGLPPSMMSAFIGAKLFSEFLIDGGYYPINGMQLLSDTLAERFMEFGGELKLSTLVKRIRLKDNKVTGVVIEKDGFIPSKLVISNCDARQTFLKLLGKDKIEKSFYERIKNMKPSISNFIVYMGIKQSFSSLFPAGSAVFFSNHYGLEKAYKAIQRNNLDEYGGFAFRVSLNRRNINVIVPTAFKSKIFWSRNKTRYLELVIEKVERFSIPDLSKFIVYKEAASPYTLYRYTLNYKGASYGWASTPNQLAVPGLRKPPSIEGLYLTGHWTTLGVGISGVIYVSHVLSTMILKKERQETS